MPQPFSWDSGLAWDDLTPGIAGDGLGFNQQYQPTYGLRQSHLRGNHGGPTAEALEQQFLTRLVTLNHERVTAILATLRALGHLA